MVPREDLFAAFSVARGLQLEVGMKTEQILKLEGKLEWSEKRRVDLEKEIAKLLNTFEIVFSGSIADLKRDLKEFDVSDIGTGQEVSVFPWSPRHQTMPEDTMGVLPEFVSSGFD
jgi:hypothetical protein